MEVDAGQPTNGFEFRIHQAVLGDIETFGSDIVGVAVLLLLVKQPRSLRQSVVVQSRWQARVGANGIRRQFSLREWYASQGHNTWEPLPDSEENPGCLCKHDGNA